MALPELISNSSVPGTVTALTTLKVELKTGVKELEVAAAAPAALHAEGQFRIILDKEILLIEGPSAATTKWKVLERAAEGSTEAAHTAGASVYHYLTAGALKTLFFANSPTVNTQPLLLSFGAGPALKSEGEGIMFGQSGLWKFGQLVQGRYEDSTPGNIGAIVGSIQNPGSRAAVALVGNALGGHVFGANLICYAKGDGGSAKNEFDFGCLPVILEIDVEQVLPGSEGQTIKVTTTSPEGFQIPSSGTVYSGGREEAEKNRTITYTGKTATTLTGCTIREFRGGKMEPPENLTFKAKGLLHVLTTASSTGLYLSSEGGNIYGGKGGGLYIVMSAVDKSATEQGIVFQVNSHGQPVLGTGSLVYTEGAVEAGWGINFEEAKFVNGAMTLGNNNIVLGTGAGVKFATSTSQKLGFWGATPIARPKVTGSRAGSAALASLVEQLANAGLIANETSA